MDEIRQTKNIYTQNMKGKRPQGRPTKTNWRNKTKKDYSMFGVNNWRRKVKD